MCARFREGMLLIVRSQIPKIAFSFDVIFSPFLSCRGLLSNEIVKKKENMSQLPI